jgi:uncharacterized membrane protein YfcA
LIGGGLFSGFTAGIIGLGGAIRGAFLINTGIKKDTYIATSAAISLFTDVARSTTYILQGNLESEYYWYIPVLLVVGLAGTHLGVKLLGRIPEIVVKRTALVMLVIVSIFFILGYFGIVKT